MGQLVISKSFTLCDAVSLSKYLSEVDKIDLLTNEEEVILARKIRQGDQEALERLTKTNLRFVISVAKQYQNRGLPLGDLINEGNIGLITAAKRYDETKGFKFISYAVWWIRQSMVGAIAEHARFIRLPYNQLTFLIKLHNAISKFEQEHLRKPSVQELSEYLGTTEEKIYDLLNKANIQTLSLDKIFSYEQNITLHEVLPSSDPATDHDVIQDAITAEILHTLRVLCPEGRELIIALFGLNKRAPLSLEEISRKLNISTDQAIRIKKKSLQKLRSCSNADFLRSCLY